LHQIGIATHTLNDANGVLPPLCAPNSSSALTVSGPYNGAVGFTVFDWLLPYVEQGPLYNLANRNGNTTVASSGGAHTVYSTVIPTYRCPSEPMPGGSLGDGLGATTNGSAHKWAIGNYAANYYAFGNPLGSTTAQREQGSNRFDASFPDGLSNTIFYTERYGTCGSSGVADSGSTLGNLWSDSNSTWRPVFCIANTSKTPGSAGYPACVKFQVMPNWIRSCDPTVAQSPHAAGINVCLGDGSVRFLSAGISSATWAAACDPRDGAPLGPDW